jgi:hypothetical protein
MIQYILNKIKNTIILQVAKQFEPNFYNFILKKILQNTREAGNVHQSAAREFGTFPRSCVSVTWVV